LPPSRCGNGHILTADNHPPSAVPAGGVGNAALSPPLAGGAGKQCRKRHRFHGRIPYGGEAAIA
jgi:hypothetical protein